MRLKSSFKIIKRDKLGLKLRLTFVSILRLNLNPSSVAVMAGLIEKDITTPYNFSKFQNQNAETTKLQAFERANFGCF